jgi:hypothetical protein
MKSLQTYLRIDRRARACRSGFRSSAVHERHERRSPPQPRYRVTAYRLRRASLEQLHCGHRNTQQQGREHAQNSHSSILLLISTKRRKLHYASSRRMMSLSRSAEADSIATGFALATQVSLSRLTRLTYSAFRGTRRAYWHSYTG